jgi:hypothetical protein
MAAVVLRGPANSAPEIIIGPFHSLGEAEDWAREHPRAGGYSVAQELTTASEFPADEETLRLRLDSAGLRALAQLGEMADRGDFDEFLGNKVAYRRVTDVDVS